MGFGGLRSREEEGKERERRRGQGREGDGNWGGRKGSVIRKGKNLCSICFPCVLIFRFTSFKTFAMASVDLICYTFYFVLH